MKLLTPLYEHEARAFDLEVYPSEYIAQRLAGATILEALERMERSIGYTLRPEAQSGEATDPNDLPNGA